jgi:glycosyltransferase involved in cell wall biosynthesis
MTPPVRVAILQQHFPPYRAAVFARLAAQRDIDLTVVHVSPDGRDAAASALGDAAAGAGLRVISGPAPTLRLAGRAILWHAAAVRTVRREPFDVVIQPLELRWASLPVIRHLQRRRGGAFVLWGHGPGAADSLADRLRRRLIRGADATIFYSDRARQAAAAAGLPAEKLFVARNSIDLDAVDAAAGAWSPDRVTAFRREHGLGGGPYVFGATSSLYTGVPLAACPPVPSEQHTGGQAASGTRGTDAISPNRGPVLLAVGRLLAAKRLDVLLRAAARLQEAMPGLRVVLVGDGPEAGPLRRLAADLGLSDHVRFTGPIHDELRLAPWMLASDLVVCPGAIGLAAIHAHAYGRAVVTSDLAAIHGPEFEAILPGATGDLYRHGSVESLAEVLGAILSDPARLARYGAAARQRSHAEFGLSRMIDGFLAAMTYAVGVTGGASTRPQSPAVQGGQA